MIIEDMACQLLTGIIASHCAIVLMISLMNIDGAIPTDNIRCDLVFSKKKTRKAMEALLHAVWEDL